MTRRAGKRNRNEKKRSVGAGLVIFRFVLCVCFFLCSVLLLLLSVENDRRLAARDPPNSENTSNNGMERKIKYRPIPFIKCIGHA